MSIQFSDTTTYKGLVQLYEQEIGANLGDVSGSTTKLKQFTADTNIAFDSFLNIALKADGGWQFDDTNHTDFPERTMTLTSGTRRYALTSFTADAGSNLMLEIYKLFIKNPAGVYVEIDPVDVQTSDPYATESFTDGQARSGTPYRYDKTGNYIDLDPVPNYTQSAGIKVLINREASYFASSDTTKKAGVPGIFHHYFYLHPAREYARRKSLPNYNLIALEVAKLEIEIQKYFSHRAEDERHVITGKRINYI